MGRGYRLTAGAGRQCGRVPAGMKFNWTVQRMDQLERAIGNHLRVVVNRRGTEFVVIALRMTTVRQRDAFIGRLPMTGEEITFILDELEGFQIVA